MQWKNPWRRPENDEKQTDYSPLPPSPPPPPPPPPPLSPSPKPRKRHFCLPFLIFLLLLLLLGSSISLLWPRQPDLQVTDITLHAINLDTQTKHGSLIPTVRLNVTLILNVRISNPNFFGMDYDHLRVNILYRGSQIGEIDSAGERIGARSVRGTNVTLSLEGVEIVGSIPALVKDMADKRLPLEAVTLVDGAVEVLFFRPRAQITIDCDFVVDLVKDDILDQNCTFPA